MSSSRSNGRQLNSMYDPYSDDDDDVMDLHMDCAGAIDGTHVVVMAPEGDQMPYRGRKVHTTQNVMAACSFDMKFTFVYTGWEDKYYLVDAGYTHMPGYVAPYRGQKYHLQEFNRRRRYHGPQELFNHRHSSLRNVIERTFRVLKQRFPLLRHMSRYDMVRQGPIVMACCVLHNWIRTVQEQDEFFDAEESSDEDEDDVEDEDEDEGEGEGKSGGEGASQVEGEVGVQNVHGNEDGVPTMQ
ncbi:putative nuclease HARBI1 [Camellia sinensis]|uniref:putative nuclease HARBI1 n=1 Tax=Camellia sinensis TaxID=4442 RepID=UPI001036F15C|nr:putative nuclease HARBI1 [Camellia sinensis]